MNLQEYYGDMRKEIAALEKEHPDGACYVTSLFHRERNSTPGTTLSASLRNAARVITDGTHRRATQEEIDAFVAHQRQEFVRNSASEQKNKRQYIVVVDQKEDKEPVLAGAGSVKDIVSETKKNLIGK